IKIMITVNTHEAKTRLSELLTKIEQTKETVLICRNGSPVAELHSWKKN
ncbi:MAG: type II toxin-antitoxin system Phd/YefM family antitoxin, partial [Nitrospinae bacterium]|nr:type II toxin-antitoxin system Phd/YefM family antitoxin [Nitrospinota bacterium]